MLTLGPITNQDLLTPPAECPPNPTPRNGHHRSFSSPPSHSVSSNVMKNEYLHSTRSNSSLFGSELTEEYRYFVKSLASHIVYGMFYRFYSAFKLN